MKLKLPNNLYAPQDVSNLLLEVREYSKWNSHNNVKKRAGTKASDPPELSDEAMDLIHEWRGNKKTITKKKLDDLIIALEDYQDAAPLMTITLAAPPTNGIKKELVEWCRKNISSDILIRFGFNRTILGGMVVRLDSHIYDWSLRRQILKNREKFPKVLRNV